MPGKWAVYDENGVKAAVLLELLPGPVILSITNWGEERAGYATKVVLDIADKYGTPIYTTPMSPDGRLFFEAITKRFGIQFIELDDEEDT